MKTKKTESLSPTFKKSCSGLLTNWMKPEQKPKQHWLPVGTQKQQMVIGERLKGSWQKRFQKDGQTLQLVWKLQAHKGDQ